MCNACVGWMNRDKMRCKYRGRTSDDIRAARSTMILHLIKQFPKEQCERRNKKQMPLAPISIRFDLIHFGPVQYLLMAGYIKQHSYAREDITINN